MTRSIELHVGQSALHGDLESYARRFDLLELRADRLPRPSRLRKWAGAVPKGFVFSIVLPPSVAALDGDATTRAALDAALQAADVLDARWVVLQTPPSATPTSRTRERLAELVARLPLAERAIGWEPRGLWQDEDAEALARKLGIHLVRDVSRSPAAAGAVVYARLRALGAAVTVRASAIERAARNIAQASVAYVVIEGRGAARAAPLLRELVAEEAEGDGGFVLMASEPELDEDELGESLDEDEDAAELDEGEIDEELDDEFAEPDDDLYDDEPEREGGVDMPSDEEQRHGELDDHGEDDKEA